ncbi:MAG: hypothetical protein ABIF04_05875, partial [Chloroflexota bacterium]
VSVNPGRLIHSQVWLDLFHTRVIGKTKGLHSDGLWINDPDIDPANLIPGKQFGLSRPDGWLKFDLPLLK